MVEWHRPSSLGCHIYKGKQLLKTTTWVHCILLWDKDVLQLCKWKWKKWQAMNLNRYLGHLALNNVFDLFYKGHKTYVRMLDAENVWSVPRSAWNILNFLIICSTFDFIKSEHQNTRTDIFSSGKMKADMKNPLWRFKCYSPTGANWVVHTIEMRIKRLTFIMPLL